MEAVNHTRIYAIVFFLLAVLGIGFVCYRVLSPFLAAIAWAIVLAIAFQKPWADPPWLTLRREERAREAARSLSRPPSATTQVR